MNEISADYDDLYELQIKYSESVYSHETAVMLHWLGAGYHSKYHMSLPKNSHVTNAKEQLIQPHCVSKSELSDEYIIVIDSWESNPIRVTNLEKTIVDMLRKEKLITETVKEMIEDYLRRETKSIKKLIEYADRFHVSNIVKNNILKHIND